MTTESDWAHEIRRLVNLLLEQEDEVDRLRLALKIIFNDPRFKNLDEQTRQMISKLIGKTLTSEGAMRGICIFVLVIATSSNALAADALKGETLAKRLCASCHVVSQRQIQGTTLTPPFSEIAKRPDFNKRSIAYFLLAPHPPMPDMSLTRSEADDLAAYIADQ